MVNDNRGGNSNSNSPKRARAADVADVEKAAVVEEDVIMQVPSDSDFKGIVKTTEFKVEK